jgi:Ca2+-binding EF-hand superfamily protein
MWEKIKKFFGFSDLNNDGKITAEDLEVVRAIADKKAKEANEAINAVNDQITDAVTQVKKATRGRKKK